MPFLRYHSSFHLFICLTRGSYWPRTHWLGKMGWSCRPQRFIQLLSALSCVCKHLLPYPALFCMGSRTWTLVLYFQPQRLFLNWHWHLNSESFIRNINSTTLESTRVCQRSTGFPFEGDSPEEILTICSSSISKYFILNALSRCRKKNLE